MSRMYYLRVCIFFVCIALVIVAGTKLQCVEIEPCLMCKTEEILAEYCKETGRRVKISCKDQDSVIEDYKSCQLSAEDERVRLIVFEVVMAIVGGIAYWGVQMRKANSMTLFDSRRRFSFDLSFLLIL